MSLAEYITSVIAKLSLQYYFHQLICILVIWVYGYFLMGPLAGKIKGILKYLLCFPTGLAAFSLTGYVMLVCAIPYTTFTVTFFDVCILVILYYSFVRSRSKNKGISKREALLELMAIPEKKDIPYLVLIFLMAGFAVSGFLSVSLSNDSMYYFSFYPREIVHFKGLRSNFDVYLTDTGLGSVIIHTLPFLYGFNEVFGVQHMMNFCMLGVFLIGLNENLHIVKKSHRVILLSCFMALFLSFTPLLIIMKWALANVYFMDYTFICVYLAWINKDKAIEAEPLLYLLIIFTSTIRIEAGIFALLLIVCISVLDYSNKQLILGMLVPVMILQALYGFRIFVTMTITAPYRFMTEEKEIIQLVLMAVVMIYFIFIRGRIFVGLQYYLRYIIPIGLLLLNGLLYVRNPEGFMENIVAFKANILHVGGWGIFPVVVIMLYAMSFIISSKKKEYFNFFDTIAFSFVLYAIAVAFMREGGLRAGVGDSGNRVLMQVVPLLSFGAFIHIFEIIPEEEKEIDRKETENESL